MRSDQWESPFSEASEPSIQRLCWVINQMRIAWDASWIIDAAADTNEETLNESFVTAGGKMWSLEIVEIHSREFMGVYEFGAVWPLILAAGF